MADASLETQITDLENAIATGARKVKLGDKETEFRDLSEMYQVLNNLKRKAATAKKAKHLTPSFKKGI